MVSLLHTKNGNAKNCAMVAKTDGAK